MNFVGVDADNRTIFGMQRREVEGVAAVEHDIVVELIPERPNCESWAGDATEGGEMNADDVEVDRVKDQE